MIASEFEYFAPTEMTEALDLLHTKGDGARPLAGGMTLVPLMRLGMRHPAIVVSLNYVAGLDQVKDVGPALSIGAMCRHDAVARDPLVLCHAPLLALAAASIRDVRVRKRGTLGGSIAHADPAADCPVALVASGATMILRSVGGERRVPAAEFFVDVMTTVLDAGELVVAVEIPKLTGLGFAHERLRRIDGEFPLVLASLQLLPDGNGRIALGGVGVKPVAFEFASGFADAASVSVLGRRAFEAAVDAVGDADGSREYRRTMARVLSERALLTACSGR
ncbi:MAG: xanthine dehydrogenase family protein subunit M [Gammaproteobacteria bacterium]